MANLTFPMALAGGASTSRSGTFAEMIALTGVLDGDSFYVTSGAGQGKSWWTYNSTSGLWTPVGNTLRFFKGVGASLAAPFGTLTVPAGLANTLFDNAALPVFSANILRAGCSVRVVSIVERSVGSGTITFNPKFGVLNAGGDGPIGSNVVGTTVGNSYLVTSELHVGSATLFTSRSGTNPFTAGTMNEQSTQFNVASAMYLTFWGTGLGVQSDAAKLHSVDVEIRYGV